MTEDKEIHGMFLSEEEKEKIKAQALKEIDAENKKKVADDYKAQIKSEAKRKALFKNAKEGVNEDGLVAVLIDLPPFSAAIVIDGTSYHHGHTYHVTPEKAEVLNETMHRGHEHEDEVKGRKDSNLGRKRTELQAR